MNIISIVVPIYNVEKFLSRCLDSILAQSLKDIEVILVNDGSTDLSLDICKDYQKKNKRIIVIDKINEGVSVARNTGIEAATGKYIGFVDPDDWIEPNMYENIYKTIEKYKCNIAFCNYSKDSKRTSNIKMLKVQKDVLGKLDIINELIANMIGIEDIIPKYYNVMGCVWRCLYRKDFIDKFHLSFQPGITIMEDLIFSVQALIYCDKVCIDHGVYYHYMKNKTSSLHSYNEKMWQDQVEVHNKLEEIIEEADLSEYMRNRLDSRYIGMAACAVGNEVYKSNANLKDRMEAAKFIIKDEKLKEVLERAKNYNFENLRYPRNKEEAETENTVIKNLLFYTNPNPLGIERKNKENIKEITE
ncbi:MAG: glycosyltransferase [Sedimentibacter sp.]